MGIGITVGSYRFEAIDYGVTEASTPLAGNDTSGSLGGFDFTIPQPDPDLIGSQETGWAKLIEFGPQFFIDLPVRLSDSRRGFTVGRVSSYAQNENGSITFECVSRLGDLNIYGVQAQPFIGTLENAFKYYLGLAQISTDLFVDPAVSARSVTYPGWNGELWYNLKMIAAAQDCEISLVSGVILLRSIRLREAARGREISRSRTLPPAQLARTVEVYRYGNRQISGELVYPPNGWRPGFEIITANAGETITQTLQLSASVTYVGQPQPQSFVVETEATQNAYTVVADDDTVIDPGVWSRAGGYVSVVINPDTTSLTLTLGTPTSLRKEDGSPYRTFSLAMPNGSGGQRYASLRILGTGVAYNKVKESVPTSVPASATATEVGATIDNPYVSTWEDVARIGVRAAMRYAGLQMEVSSSLISINKRGDSGDATYPTYGQVETALKSVLGSGATYGQVQTRYVTTLGLPTYGAIQDYWFSTVQSNFENQAYGNAAGARFYDKRTRRWYRIRSGDFDLGTIETSAEDDLTYGDVGLFYNGKTYGDLQSIFGNFDYQKAWYLGLLEA